MTSQFPVIVDQVREAIVSWPLLTFLELEAAPVAARVARRHARHVLRDWGLAALADDMELVVSELAANAIAASAAADLPGFRLWLVSDGTRAAVFLWDGHPGQPEPAEPDADAEQGRGLQLVEAVTADWGWYVPEDGNGTVVWAVANTAETTEKEFEFL